MIYHTNTHKKAYPTISLCYYDPCLSWNPLARRVVKYSTVTNLPNPYLKSMGSSLYSRMLPLSPLFLDFSPTKDPIITLLICLQQHYQGMKLVLSLFSSSQRRDLSLTLQKVILRTKIHTIRHLKTKYLPQMSNHYLQKFMAPCNEEFLSMWMFCNVFIF